MDYGNLSGMKQFRRHKSRGISYEYAFSGSFIFEARLRRGILACGGAVTSPCVGSGTSRPYCGMLSKIYTEFVDGAGRLRVNSRDLVVSPR